MRRGGGGRQRAQPKVAASPFNDPAAGRRDSDASMCSSRPSSAGGRSAPTSSGLLDRAAQAGALRSINAYLAAVSAPFQLKPPLPSARDIASCLRLLLSRLDIEIGPNLDDDLLLVLRQLGCPVKLNRSALRAPGTPHAWPHILSAAHWLAQLARYADHLAANPPPPGAPTDFHVYVTKSYSLFMSGDDSAVSDLDQDYIRETERGYAAAAASVAELEREAAELEERARGMRAGPSRREALERERDVLVEDCRKFESVVESFKEQVGAMEVKMGDWERELEAKETENKRICEENKELRTRIDGQAVNARDVERMRRELQAVEREIGEAENGRNALEEKAWELEAEIGRKWKEIEAMAEQCNQATRKLKLSSDIQYTLNPQGSSPAEVMGIDYKSIVKPALAAFSEDGKKTLVSKLEELKALRQQSRENATIIEEKKGRLAALQTRVAENEARLSSMKEEVEDYASTCASEAGKVQEEFKRKEQQLSTVEKEAEQFVKSAEEKLQNAIAETDEETQMCAGELLTVVDEVTSYKEFTESLTAGMRADLVEVVRFVGEARASAVSATLTRLD